MLKRFLAVLFVVILLPVSALAKNWGLNGELLDLVTKSGEWEMYDSLCPQVGNIAVLHAPYHQVLIMADEGKLKTYTNALFQWDDNYAVWPQLSAEEDTFLIYYDENLWVSFIKNDDHYILSQAQFNDLSVNVNADKSSYTFTNQKGKTAVMRRSIWLEHFNIGLFPKTIEEVRHLNWMLASLDSGQYVLGTTDSLMQFAESLSKAPVYTAPYANDSLRAANGHATVSFKGDVWILTRWRNEYGGEYYLIRYDVNPSLQRIGFIRRNHVDGVGADPWDDNHALNARVVTLRKTCLTDDPDVSQMPVLRLSEGARLRCMGTYDDNFAYVSTVDTLGRIVWGFVPLKDLTMLSSRLYDPDTELMEQLAGVWWHEDGENNIADLFTLRNDGTYKGFLFSAAVNPDQAETSGRWYVTKYDPSARLYWDNPEYEITFISDDGTAMVDGLSYTEDTMFTSNIHNGNTYRKVDQAQ